MSVYVENCKSIYQGNGATREWGYDFPLPDASYMEVYVTEPNGTPVLLTSGYTVNMAAMKVVYPASIDTPALAGGWTLTLRRVVPLTQPIELPNQQGRWLATNTEMGLDRLVMMIQQLRETLSRAVVGPVDQTDSGVAYQTLLDAVEEARRLRDETAALVVGLSEQNAAELRAALAILDAELAEGMAAITAATAADAEAARAAAEEARRHAQDYIPYSFGRFRIDDNANLVVEYFGDSGQDDITINEDGEVIITTGGETL